MIPGNDAKKIIIKKVTSFILMIIMIFNAFSVIPNTAIKVSAADIPANAIHITNANILTINWAQPDKYYMLDEDIDLTAEWVPIDNFGGTFDGRGHSINNLYVLESSRKQYAGLFGQITASGVTIKNVELNIGAQGVHAHASFPLYSSDAGGLVGNCTGTTITIENCRVTGDVYAQSPTYTYSATAYAGGLIGYCGGSATLENCCATGDIDASSFACYVGISSNIFSYAYSGGLIGYCGVTITIEDCYTTGDISVYAESDSGSGNIYSYRYEAYGYAGGLVGLCGTTNGSTITIKDCHTTGFVYVYAEGGAYGYAGGLIGLCGKVNGNISETTVTIENCYATGDISVHAYYDYTAYYNLNACAGGLIGYWRYKSNAVMTIKNCYATGFVYVFANSYSVLDRGSAFSPAAYGGGLLGYCVGNGGCAVTIENCYAKSDVDASAGAAMSPVLYYPAAYAGGLIGYCGGDGCVMTVSKCYAAGDVSADVPDDSSAYKSYSGGLIGYRFLDTVTVINCYRLSSQKIAGIVKDESGIELTHEKMKDKTNFTGWDFANIWDYMHGINDGYPVLRKTITIIGDVNGDCKVDMDDLICLAKHIAEIQIIDPDLEILSDVNGDGKINIADLIFLSRWLAGYDDKTLLGELKI